MHPHSKKEKIKERVILNGIISAMNIPFDESDKVDYDSPRNEVVNGIDAGVVASEVRTQLCIRRKKRKLLRS